VLRDTCSAQRIPVVAVVSEAQRYPTFAAEIMATPIDSLHGSSGPQVTGRRSCAYRTGQGPTFHMSAAYSLIVRSLENLPELATFKMVLRAQSSGWAYSSTSRWSASR